jgi:Mg/Co/Ni transporter MgtE
MNTTEEKVRQTIKKAIWFGFLLGIVWVIMIIGIYKVLMTL